MKKIMGMLLVVAVWGWLVCGVGAVETSERMLEGSVVRVVESGHESGGVDGELKPFQVLEVELESRGLEGEVLRLSNSSYSDVVENVFYQEYEPGDRVKIFSSVNYLGEPMYELAGKLKRPALMTLTVLFLMCVLVVGRVWGALSLVGMGMSFMVIFKVIIPLIIGGMNPVVAAVLGALIIIPITFYISHGFNVKTHVGVISTLLALSLTGILAVVFVEAANLTGFASEEAGFLQVERRGSIDIRGLLIAGIIIGVLGILDDVTIGQASVVNQIKEASPKISAWNLFQKGMKVGQDHISSMVNTLVLVYAGSALPLLLLFFDDQRPFTDIIEFELIAEEIVRMLVGSIGLVLVAPLATALAAVWYCRMGEGEVKRKKE